MYGGFPLIPIATEPVAIFTSSCFALTPGGTRTYRFRSSSVWSHSYTTRPSCLNAWRFEGASLSAMGRDETRVARTRRGAKRRERRRALRVRRGEAEILTT